MFTVDHFAWLGICATIIIAGTVLSKKLCLSEKNAIAVFFYISVVSEASRLMICMVQTDEGGYILGHKDLPFHLCSLAIFASAYLMFSKTGKWKSAVKSALVAGFIIAPAFAMIIPTEGVSFGNPLTYQYFIYHASLMWFSLYFLVTGQAEMGKKAYCRNLINVSFLIIFVIYLNSMLSAYDVNFFFLRRPPIDGLPIVNMDNGWYVYFITILAIAYGSITVMHLPFMIKERQHRKRQNEGHKNQVLK